MEEVRRIEKITGDIYGTLFSDYDDRLFEESLELFYMRHKMWGIDLDWFKGKVCLDAGCGGGRFVVAIGRLGAKKVYGVDISGKALEAARRRPQAKALGNKIEFIEASVLNLPFDDETFDYVVCSGVLMCTANPTKGFKEIVRVLKRGGKLFLSVYGRGGVKWALCDIMRVIGKVIPFQTMVKIWRAAGVPANKRYNFLDNFYIPKMARYTEREVREWLVESGFENIRRVKFERYDYEKLLSRIIHGEGWLQFYADKK